jgi:hypothetical protein
VLKEKEIKYNVLHVLKGKEIKYNVVIKKNLFKKYIKIIFILFLKNYF